MKKQYILLFFAIIGLIVFGSTLGFNYTYLDDHTLILEKMNNLKEISYVKKAFTEEVFHSGTGKGYYYRPLLTLSFMFDAMLGQGKFTVFHLSNIIYHVLACWLLFLFLLELGFDYRKSWLMGILFLVHPLATQAVAWVPGRNDTLLAIFVLSSAIYWLKYLKVNKLQFILLHLATYIMALLTKENALVLPFVLILYSWLIVKSPLKKLWAPALMWVGITFLWAVLRNHMIGGDTGVPLSTQAFSVLKNLPALLPFAGKMFFPFDLSVFPIMADMKISTMLGILALVCMVSIALFTKGRDLKIYLFAIAWFLSFLLPAFIAITHQIPNFSEHRVYVPMVGLVIFLISSEPVLHADLSGWKSWTIIAGIGLLFSVLTITHSRNFKDNITFWTNAVESSPTHAFNYNNLGAMYFLAGDYAQAEPFFREALKINPYEPMANSNTGLICMNTDRPAEAEKYYLEEIRINPKYEHAYYNLGLLYYKHGRPIEALPLWEKILTINPYYADAYKALLQVYSDSGRRDDFSRISFLAKKNEIQF